MPVQIDSIFIHGIAKFTNKIGARSMFQTNMPFDMCLFLSLVVTNFTTKHNSIPPNHRIQVYHLKLLTFKIIKRRQKLDKKDQKGTEKRGLVMLKASKNFQKSDDINESG